MLIAQQLLICSTTNFCFCPGLAGSDVVEASASRAQEEGVLEACQEVGLIIFNTFALEAYHVAEKMQMSYGWDYRI